jgi:bilin biosynthesis protein
MSNSINSNSESISAEALAAIHAANDALVAGVNDQISLGTFDDTNATVMQQLVEGLGDPRGLVRLRFAETLGDIGEAATPFLVQALSSHENVVVRRAAAKTLTLIADPTAVPTLLHSFLNDQDTVVKGSAAGALARTGEAAVPALLEILADESIAQETKGHAAWALAFIGAEAAEYLYQAIDSTSLDVRCAVIAAIGHVAQEQTDPKSCGLLITALTDPEPLIRTEAAAALGQVNYPAAVSHLILALHDRDLDVRKAAINALGKIGDQVALEPLKLLLEDEAAVVRTLAKLAIAQLERTEASDW